MAGETLPTGSTNTQGLADWAAPYITNYLGKAQALSETPYQTYQGPLTAGASNLQNKVFSGLAGLTFPSNLGQSFASPMGGNTNNYGGPIQGGLQIQQPPMGNYTGGSQYQKYPGNPQVLPDGSMNPDPAVYNRADILAGLDDSGMGGGTGGPMAVMPASRAPRTEDDWNRHSSMARYAPGTDMEKAKADFLAGSNQFGGNKGAMPPGGDYAVSPAQGGITGLLPPQTSQQPSNIAQSYMNPYLQNVLTPQLDELRRQNDITNAATNAKMTQAGGFGGGRQAIMNAENYRNLMQEQNKTVGQGYSSAYDKAMAQFNTEQGQAKDLANMMSTQGGIERGIESEGIAADLGEFEKQRQYPFQQVQFQRDMISGLPTGSVQNTPGQMSGVGQLLSALGGGTAAAKAFGYKDVSELLKGLGLTTGSSS
jgi:hypothetical protein